ncbi:MAG: hypothetical protein ACK52J_03550, partial [bacterium]
TPTPTPVLLKFIIFLFFIIFYHIHYKNNWIINLYSNCFYKFLLLKWGISNPLKIFVYSL